MLRMKVNYLNYHESKKPMRPVTTKLCKQIAISCSLCLLSEQDAQLITPSDVTPRGTNQETHRLKMTLKRQIAAR